MRILALDDEAAIGRVVQLAAQSLGLAVEPTVCASAFRMSFERGAPDAVLLDLNIGDEDGIEQLRFLSDQRYQGPIILLSGLGPRVLDAAQKIGEGLGLNIISALQKPMRVAALRIAFQQLLPKLEQLSANRLRQAIEAGELVLEFQPVVDAASGKFRRAEALLRWDHPELG